MAILPIYTYDHPILRQKAQTVEELTAEVQEFIANMKETMANAHGIGLAANQVGSPLSIAIIVEVLKKGEPPRKADDLLEVNYITPAEDEEYIDDDAQDEEGNTCFGEPYAIINPVIEWFSEQKTPMEEGCLSLPGYRDDVTRPLQIIVRYRNENWEEVIRKVSGMEARILLHEIDHLNGVYFFDRLLPVQRAMGHHRLKRIASGKIETDYPLAPPPEPAKKRLGPRGKR